MIPLYNPIPVWPAAGSIESTFKLWCDCQSGIIIPTRVVYTRSNAGWQGIDLMNCQVIVEVVFFFPHLRGKVHPQPYTQTVIRIFRLPCTPLLSVRPSVRTSSTLHFFRGMFLSDRPWSAFRVLPAHRVPRTQVKNKIMSWIINVSRGFGYYKKNKPRFPDKGDSLGRRLSPANHCIIHIMRAPKQKEKLRADPELSQNKKKLLPLLAGTHAWPDSKTQQRIIIIYIHTYIHHLHDSANETNGTHIKKTGAGGHRRQHCSDCARPQR